VATETFTTYPPMQWLVTLQLDGELTGVELYSRTPVTHKFTPLAYQQVMNSNQN